MEVPAVPLTFILKEFMMDENELISYKCMIVTHSMDMELLIAGICREVVEISKTFHLA